MYNFQMAYVQYLFANFNTNSEVVIGTVTLCPEIFMKIL